MDARPIPAGAPGLVAALRAADLPVEDVGDGGGSFYAFEQDGLAIGFGGFETYGADVLLRSVVVLPASRGKGHGRALTEAVLGRAAETGARTAYLLTTTADAFFEQQGFVRIERSQAPASILATRQASTICSTAALLRRAIPQHG